jgi:hypothetical protein
LTFFRTYFLIEEQKGTVKKFKKFNKMEIEVEFDVFLSYNSIDKQWVIRLKDELLKRGLRVWLEQDETRPGDLFVNVLEQAIQNRPVPALPLSHV